VWEGEGERRVRGSRRARHLAVGEASEGERWVRERGGGEGLGTLRWARQGRERGGGEGLGTLTAWKPRRLCRGTPTAVISAVTSAALSGSPSTYMMGRGVLPRQRDRGKGREGGGCHPEAPPQESIAIVNGARSGQGKEAGNRMRGSRHLESARVVHVSVEVDEAHGHFARPGGGALPPRLEVLERLGGGVAGDAQLVGEVLRGGRDDLHRGEGAGVGERR